MADFMNGKGPQEVDLSEWHAFQTWLELAGDKEVTIPYAHQIAEKSDARAVRLRRDFGAILNLIATHAILHQAYRDRDVDGRIIATLEDYKAIYELVYESISEGVQAAVRPVVREVVLAASELLENSKNQSPPKFSISVTDIANHTGKPKQNATNYVKEAIEKGWLINSEWRKGLPFSIQVGDKLPEDTYIIPNPEQIDYFDF